MRRCSEMEMRCEIAKKLGQAVNKICKGTETANALEDLIEDFVDAAEFSDYFKAIWYPKLGMWTRALKTLPLASQETSSAMEFYHNQLKVRLLNGKDESMYHRADWLVNKLVTKVHSYFWLDEYSGREDFARYWKDEWMSGLTAWRKSLKIPDAHIVEEGKCAKVLNDKDQDKAHLVYNPGSEYAICDCSWAKMGNLCEHIFKLIKFYREKGSVTPSMSMFQYSRALINMLHCPPFDSLARDHAVSLAVWVQMQLNGQVEHLSIPEKFTEPSKGSPDRVLDNENHNGPQIKISSGDMEIDTSVAADLMDADVGTIKDLPSTDVELENLNDMSVLNVECNVDDERSNKSALVGCSEMAEDPSSKMNSSELKSSEFDVHENGNSHDMVSTDVSCAISCRDDMIASNSDHGAT